MTNAIAAMTPEKGRLPIALANDREAITAALSTIGPISMQDARMIHIKNTLALEVMEISTALRSEIENKKDMVIEKDIGPLDFDQNNCVYPVQFS